MAIPYDAQPRTGDRNRSAPAAAAAPDAGAQGLLAPDLLRAALKQSFVMLRPDIQWKNPVMFVVEVGAVLDACCSSCKRSFGGSASQVPVTLPHRPGRLAVPDGAVRQLRHGAGRGARQGPGRVAAPHAPRHARLSPAPERHHRGGLLDGAEAGRPRRRRGRPDHPRRRRDHRRRRLGRRVGDHRRVGPGHPRGRRRPLRRHRRHAVLSDRIVVRITAAAGESFLDRMIALVEGAIRQRTPNEIALSLVLSAFTLIFLIVVVPLWPMALERRAVHDGLPRHHRAGEEPGHRRADAGRAAGLPDPDDHRRACWPPSASPAWTGRCGPTSSPRAARRSRWPATSTRVLLDKTGTITIGNRHATQFLPVGGYAAAELARLAALASVADETPGRQDRS